MVNVWHSLLHYFSLYSIRQTIQKVLHEFWMAILSFIFSTRWRINSEVVIARILLSTPITHFFLIITFKKIYTTVAQLYKVCRNNLKLPRTWFGGTALSAKTVGDQSSYVESQTAAKPLIQPTSTVTLGKNSYLVLMCSNMLCLSSLGNIECYMQLLQSNQTGNKDIWKWIIFFSSHCMLHNFLSAVEVCFCCSKIDQIYILIQNKTKVSQLH